MKKLFMSFMLTLILMAAFFSSGVQADTLICERYFIDRSIIFTYTTVAENIENEQQSDIVSIFSRFDGFSAIKFRNGEHIYINSLTVSCHAISGDSDEFEINLVEDFIDSLTGEGQFDLY